MNKLATAAEGLGKRPSDESWSPSSEVSPLGLTYVDLFAGAGGMSLGFKMAGYACLGAFDNWAPAVETYRANLDETAKHLSITVDLQLPMADLIIGGPPCQGFSSAGARRSEDHRNSLVSAFAQLIARHRPRAFVFENVEGFLTAGDGSFVNDLLGPLLSAGYHIHLRKINMANYGVGQNRKRVVAIGGLGAAPPFPEPTHNAFGAPGAELASKSGLPPSPTLAEVLHELPEAGDSRESCLLEDHYFVPLGDEDLIRARMLSQGQSMRNLPEEMWHQSYRRRAFRRVKDGTPTERRGGAPTGVRRLISNEPSKAITGGALHEFLHPSEDRALTLRECACIQTFPTWYRFMGSQAEKSQLIGNAVPPHFSHCLANVLAPWLQASDPSVQIEAGQLVSFIPTLSTGMSPALNRVTSSVINKYMRNDLTSLLETTCR